MTALSNPSWSESDEAAIRAELDRILMSSPFQQSRRRQRFLEFVVSEALAGRGDRIKAYAIALEVFDRPASFDPQVDPLVRIEAGRLRDKLREYYDGAGRDDAVRIDLPKGSYTPQIMFRDVHSGLVDRGVANANDAAGPVMAAVAHVPRYDLAAIDWKQLAALSVCGLVLAAVVFRVFFSAPEASRPSERPSIAVLPFDNLGGDARWQRFADGITEDIITDLAHFRNLDVIARNSTATFKGKPVDVRQVGRSLGVAYVLEGSIQSMDERIRVTAQLIEAGSGNHVWSERFDRPAVDLFSVQSELTQRIAATLGGYGGAVAEAERRVIRRKPPSSLTAFDTYLLGIEAKHKVTKESLFEAERLFRRALELDPQLARAHVALVDTQFYLIDLGLAPSVEEAVSKLIHSAEMAATLDPNDGKAHASLGLANLYKGNAEQAAAEFDRAESLAPSDADTLLCIAWSLPLLGQSDRGARLADRALVLNPHHPDWYNQGLSFAYFFGGQFDKAIKYRLLVKEPLALDYAFLAMSYAYLGREPNAQSAAQKVAGLDPAWNAERYLSEGGGYPDKEAELFVDGARKAGLPACMTGDKLPDHPNFIRVKSCDLERSRTAG
ncbi:MAG: hypothetical protein NW216_03455 [Hyphomicrobium sp.]|nr:hypothetical protein [Hyphomicrobium sp.]